MRFPVPKEEFDAAFRRFVNDTDMKHMQAGLTAFDNTTGGAADPCRVLTIGVAVRAHFKQSLAGRSLYIYFSRLFKLSDSVTSHAYLLKIEGLFTQG